MKIKISFIFVFLTITFILLIFFKSLFENKTWGRTIEGGDDFHIQDNGATASFLYRNIDEVHKEIVNIVEKEYGVNVSEACRFNKHIIDTYKRDNVEKQFNKILVPWKKEANVEPEIIAEGGGKKKKVKTKKKRKTKRKKSKRRKKSRKKRTLKKGKK